MHRACQWGICATIGLLSYACMPAASSNTETDGTDGTADTTDTSTSGADTSTATTAGATGMASAGATGGSSSASTAGASAGTTGGGTTSSGTTSGTGLDPTDPSVHFFVPGGYYVDGPNVYDSTGKKHMFHGLDRPSLEWDPNGQDLAADNYAAMRNSWKANIVRLPLNQVYWNNNQSGYQSRVADQISQIHQNGMDVILDLHRSEGPGGTPAQQCMADPNSVKFWTSVATAHKDKPYVLFELYNEPQMYSNWAFWLNGGPVSNGSPAGCTGGSYTAVGMQQLYAAVRGTGARNVVIVGGINWAYDLSFATSSTYQIKDPSSPYNDGKAYNVMFAAHPYYKPADMKTMANWNLFGEPSAKVPVILTEFGDQSQCSGTFNQQVIAYADAHNMHWTAWAWWNAGCDFPALVSNVHTGTPTAAGMPVMQALQGY